ncbi:hypothetical protein BDR03DRAFT_971598 [Suillus americanus]|nr:hypothetical protein BDR03DRAFT_971598 [Suillus americanus]
MPIILRVFYRKRFVQGPFHLSAFSVPIPIAAYMGCVHCYCIPSSSSQWSCHSQVVWDHSHFCSDSRISRSTLRVRR